MNKINYFYASAPNSLPASVFTGESEPTAAKIELVAGLILDSEPENYEIEVLTPDFTLFERQPIPKGKIINLKLDDLIAMQLNMSITINKAAAYQKYEFTFKLFKSATEIKNLNTMLYIIGEDDVRKTN